MAQTSETPQKSSSHLNAFKNRLAAKGGTAGKDRLTAGFHERHKSSNLGINWRDQTGLAGSVVESTNVENVVQ